MKVDLLQSIKVLESTLKFQSKRINDKKKELKELEYDYKVTEKNIEKFKLKLKQ